MARAQGEPTSGATTAVVSALEQEPPRACVLVVDDDRRNLFAVAEVLRELEHDVVLAHSGEEALAALLRQDFAVILLDVHMSGLSGYDTAALIRSRERSRITPIIFLTAVHQDDAHVFAGYEAGAVDYLIKPINPTILRAKVAVFADLFRKTAEIERTAAAEKALTLEKLAAERALRRREEEQSVILKSLRLALYKVPTTNPHAPRFVRGNVEQITGFPPERFLNDGELWASRLHPEDRARILRDLAPGESDGRATVEYRWLHADGVYRVFLDQAVLVVEPGGRERQVVGTWLDITERKALEDRLHHAQKLEALGRLTGGVAHDLNNLLTVVKGNLIMVGRLAGEHEKMGRLIDAAVRAAERGESLGR